MKSNIEVRHGYVYLRFSGEWDSEKIKKALQETREECNRLHNSKVLIDFLNLNFDNMNISNRIVFSTLLFDAFEYLPEAQIASIIDEESYDDTVETFDNMKPFGYKVFHTKYDALSWLKE